MLEVAISEKTDGLSIGGIKRSFVAWCSVKYSATVSFFRIPEIISCFVHNKVVNNPVEVIEFLRFLQKSFIIFGHEIEISFFKKGGCFFYLIFCETFLAKQPIKGSRGRSGESIRLPAMRPGFNFQTRRHMWVEFVGSSGFSPGTPVFLSPQKPIFDFN